MIKLPQVLTYHIYKYTLCIIRLHFNLNGSILKRSFEIFSSCRGDSRLAILGHIEKEYVCLILQPSPAFPTLQGAI